MQELEFYYLLPSMVGKFFRNWKYSVLQHQNNLSVVISSNCNCVNSDFQRIKLEDKRLLLSSNSWKCSSGVKLISSWNLILMWEVCDPEMEEKGLCIFILCLFLHLQGHFYLGRTCPSVHVEAAAQWWQISSKDHLSPRVTSPSTLHIPTGNGGTWGSPIPTNPSINCFSDRCGTEMKQPNKPLRGLTSAEALSLLPCWWTLQAELFHGIQGFITPGWKELMLLSEAAQRHKTCGTPQGKASSAAPKRIICSAFLVVLFFFQISFSL